MRAQVADIFTMNSLVAFDMAGNQIAEVALLRQLASAWPSSGLVIGPVIVMTLISGVAMEMAHIESHISDGLFSFHGLSRPDLLAPDRLGAILDLLGPQQGPSRWAR
jgi:hypothetical protein